MKIKLFLLLFFSLFSAVAASEIDPAAFSEFSNKNENEIIEILRSKYNIKVIILESSDPKNSNLTIGNLEEDKDLIAYLKKYEPTKDHYHLEPFEHSHGLLAPQIFRPNLDQHIIVLQTNATRAVILHEFMHYYLDGGSSPVNMSGILHSPSCGAYLEVRKLEDLLFLKKKNPSSDEKEVLKLAGNMISQGIDYYAKGYGEEIDVYRFMAEHQKKMGLTPQEASESLERVKGYCFILVNKIFLELDLESWVSRFQESLLKEDDELKSLYRVEITEKLQAVQDRIDGMIQWANSQN